MIRSLAAAFAVLVCTAAGAQSRYIVEFERSDRAHARFRSDLGKFSPRIATNGMRVAPFVRHEYTLAAFGVAIEAPESALADIRALPYVRAVHPDRKMKALQFPPTQAPIDFGKDAAKRVNASGLGTRGAGITIAVIDTGIDYKHASLGGGFGEGFKVAGGWDFVSDDADPLDDAGHGTHVAAIVAGDGEGLLGVAPEATLIAYKVLGAEGSGDTSDVVAAIERAMDPNGDGNPADHVDVINLSLGAPGHPDDLAARAADRAVAAGVVVVAAAGNSSRMLTIGSPGAARNAITVAAYDEFEQIAPFSSKGPASKTYGFKPDISAPGNMIISAQHGGGTVQKSGTSMAAPHVAGAAALLLALHPDWTPADVKAALMSSARDLRRSSDPYASGAGKLDVTAAATSTLHVSSNGISFGLNAAATGQWQQSQTIRVTNRSNSVENLSVINPGAPDGLTFTVTPSQLRLEPGQSADLTLRVSANNAALEYPFGLTFYSMIRVGSATSGVNVSWALVRGARATFTYDKPFTGDELIRLITSDGETEVVPEPGAAVEAILQAGKYDVMMQTFERTEADSLPHLTRIILAENHDIAGEKTIALRSEQAPHRFVMNAVDEQSRPLASLERGPRRRYIASARINYGKTGNDAALEGTFVVGMSSIREVWTSTLPMTYELLLAESYLDAESGRAISVAHPKRVGVTAGATFTSDPSQLVQATVRHGEPLSVCLDAAYTGVFGTSAFTMGCLESELKAFDVRATPDASINAHIGISFLSASMETPPLRAFNNELVLTQERTPSQRDGRVPHNGEIVLGLGPLHPIAFFGTGGYETLDYPFSGLSGPNGERPWFRALWTMRDENGAMAGSGTAVRHAVPPLPKPGYRFHAILDDLLARERNSRGEVEVQFGASEQDLVAPMITSLSLRNASGVKADVLARGEKATLHFSAGDFDIGPFPRLQPRKSSATRAAYRVSGTTEWIPVALTLTATETGDRSDTGHWAAGDFYRGEFTAPSRDAQLDLRIELEDLAGNHFTWTQERAVVVGTLDQPTGGRRRSVR